jgi:glycerol transport system permease protein
MEKIPNQKAWLLVLPVFALVAFSAVIPLMTVVNYSVQDTFGNNKFFWNGIGWYQELLDPSTELGGRFFASLWRNLAFSAIVLAIEMPLGILVALAMPREGWGVAFSLVVLALPLLIPWNVVGTIWQIFGRTDIGLLGYTLHWLGSDYNYVASPLDAWLTIIAMDVWHWSSLVALLCYAGLKSIPEAFYQAASIDGASRWAVFRAIQLPKMKRVLLIAGLLRFMDSFMIYTEPFVVTGGGPGNSTTFLSIEVVKLALGQFDLGKAAAMSIVYMLIIIITCWVYLEASPRSTTCPADGRRGTSSPPPMPSRARCSAASTRHTPSAMRWRKSSSKPAGCCGTAGTTMPSSPTSRPGASSGRAASMCRSSRASTSRSKAA